MKLLVLGPLELRLERGASDLGQPRRRAVLAALAADAGRPVSMETLLDRLWDGDPPDGARSVVYSHISRLRRLLEEAAAQENRGTATQPSISLGKVSGGYVLRADEDAVDLTRFRALVERGREPACPDAERTGMLEEALRLWRGTPLAGLPGTWADRTRTAWTRERIDAALACAQIHLRRRTPEKVPELLRPLLVDHPLNEQLAALLMRSLAATGSTADALHVYTETRKHLSDELDLPPGPELRSLYEELSRGADLRRPSAPRRPATPVPAQLPMDVRPFIGRSEQLVDLTRALTPADSGAGATAAVVSAVSGTAGVGKTALAVHWAHRSREAFPDGQLYVDLRGYDARSPLSAAQALVGFLTALGVPLQEIPLRLEDRAARYRTALNGRRLLVILDNAASAAQVRPLLPGSPECRVLITSRDSLSALVSVHGAHRVVLGALSGADSLALLRALIGERVDAERSCAEDLARQCAWLPLALRVAAELVLSRPTEPLSGLVAELHDHQRRLDLLASGDDPRAAVRAVFSWSYARLADLPARLFRFLGLHPGPDADLHSVAALADESVDAVRRALDVLVRAHLVNRSGGGRYGMHDLLRVYAAELAERHDPQADRDAALTRLLDHCLAAAAAAMGVLYPAERHLRPAVERPATGLPPLRTAEEARAWLTAAQPTLVALCSRTQEPGPSRHTVRIATTLHRHYERTGHYTDALTVHTHALRAARSVGDQRGEADVLAFLGAVHRRLGDYDTARRLHDTALALCRRTGYAAGEARHLTNVGVLLELRGRYREAAEQHERAVALFRSVGDAHGEADVLNNLGIVLELVEDFKAAIERYERALTLYRTMDHAFGEASALGNLGILLARLGGHTAAAGHFERALTLFRRLGNASGTGHALTNLGNALSGLDRHAEAAGHQREALELFRRIGERYGEAGALNGLGEALHGLGRPAEALEAYANALEVAREIDEQEEQARAHVGTAVVLRAGEDPAGAAGHLREALELYTALESPRAQEVTRMLNGD
ncbi:tetratricopeptide repeat protein [Streptomyces sp. SLBN-31]|uniref:AfsR/SARP family transcriptional regulator n=1 Tax=Streptomyces sp. SLBN-31 TaxID=2768444 RepID=UPI001167F6D6|nr:tetratricopeptide repeat protein [Streptomyces sp. SLBN-31]TQJ92183.1 DNA-binding SARP family transcriptional activator [Streptomyces sp. SLBN-31]